MPSNRTRALDESGNGTLPLPRAVVLPCKKGQGEQSHQAASRQPQAVCEDGDVQAHLREESWPSRQSSTYNRIGFSSSGPLRARPRVVSRNHRIDLWTQGQQPGHGGIKGASDCLPEVLLFEGHRCRISLRVDADRRRIHPGKASRAAEVRRRSIRLRCFCELFRKSVASSVLQASGQGFTAFFPNTECHGRPASIQRYNWLPLFWSRLRRIHRHRIAGIKPLPSSMQSQARSVRTGKHPA